MQGYGIIRTKYLKEKQGYYFEGKLARSQHWFAIDLEWPETKFKTRGTEFYKRVFQCNIAGQDGSEVSILPVTIVD